MSTQNFQSEAHCSTIETIDHVPAESEAPLSRPESPENFEPELEEENDGELYHRGPKAESVADYLYKFRDDSVKPRQFLGTDSEDGIEAILSERQGHSLHECIDGDDPLRPFIDFDLPREKFDKIEPKLTAKEIPDLLCRAFSRTCREIYPEWNSHTLTIASSSDKKKMSLHISTFGLKLKNIARVAVFTELVRNKLPVGLQSKEIVDNIANKNSFSLRMLNTPKVIEIKCNESGRGRASLIHNKKSYKHIRPKRALFPKDGTVFDFMLRPPHDEAEVKNSPILDILKEKTSIRDRKTLEKNKIDTGAIGSEIEYIEKLLEEYKIECFEVLYPSPTLPNVFPLNRIAESQCPLCNRDHTSDNAYVIRNKKTYYYYCHRADQETQTGTRKPSLKLTLNVSVLERENSLPSPEKIERPRISDPNDHFVWGDLIRMCTSKKNFTRNEVYNAIQATLACVVKDKRTWILKHRKLDGRLYFGMAPTLDFSKITINIVELGGEPIKLISLIDRIYMTAR